ncbi:MAG: type II secretion system protein N [Xanthomonadales bacterium]|jgi:hypothetical protein|nr:type II secretion system protein N [Xanthomonadales bacterium]
MKKLFWTLLILGLIVAIVALTAPAKLLTDRIAERNPQLQFGGVSGPWWRGEVADLRARQRPLGRLNWQVRPASLLQAPLGVDWTLGGAGIELQGVLLRPDTTVELQDVRGRVDARWLQPAVGIPLLSFTGQVEVNLKHLRSAGQGLPEAMDLALNWVDAGVSGLAAAPLGTIRFTVRGERGRFEGRVDSQPGDPLQVDGSFQLAERRYRAEVRLHPRDPNDPVASALRWVGQPDGAGGRLLIVDGELLLPPVEAPPS